MSEPLRPALEPDEWALRRSGSISVRRDDTLEYLVIQGPSGAVTVSGADEIFALMCLANDALPRDDARKITHSWLARVEAVRDTFIAFAGEGDERLESDRRALARGWDQMAQALSAMLPPPDKRDD